MPIIHGHPFRTSAVRLIVVLGLMLISGVALSAERAVALQRHERTSVGTAGDGNIFIGVVTDGAELIAYVCDGTDAGVSLWAWFRGPVTDGRADLVSANGVTLTLDLTGDPATGQVVTRDGTILTFGTEIATGDAGVWRAEGTVEGARVVAGWVVLNDGRQRGAQIADGTSNTVTRLNTSSPTVNVSGATLTASKTWLPANF